MTVALIAAAAWVLFFTVDMKDLVAWSTRYQTTLVPVALLAIAGIGFLLQRRKQTRNTIQQASREQGAEPAQKTDPAADAAKNRAEQVVTWAKDLKLKQKRWFHWGHVQPWVLIAGDASTVTVLMQELATKGSLVTDAAVLLWGGLGTDGRPDERWLRQIRRMRFSRPLDAIALVLDGTAPLLDSASWGIHLARITELLRWSAPVYVVDVAGADFVHRSDTPVMGCEFTRPLNTSAIETALLELRDQLADRSVYQLADNGQDTYASELSKRLDTRSAPLARWIAGLTEWQRHSLPVAGAFFARHAHAARDRIPRAGAGRARCAHRHLFGRRRGVFRAWQAL
jgi:type VI secretion system protein ImpL